MTVEIVTLNSVGSKTGNHAHIVTRMLFVGPYLRHINIDLE